MKPSAIKFIDLDVSALAARLQDDSLYGEYQARQYAPGSPHSEMKDIWVRYNAPDKIGPHFNDEHESVWYPTAFKIPELFKVVFDVMAASCGERLGGVLITKIPPGGKIERHTDSGWHAGHYDKFYVPIQNDVGSKFCWDDMEIDPRPGEVWWFDNSIPHWVSNDSLRDRISLIVCVKTFFRGTHADGFRSIGGGAQRTNH